MLLTHNDLIPNLWTNYGEIPGNGIDDDDNGDDDDGSEIFIDTPGTGSIDVSPTKTTTYFVKVTTNGVECVTEKTITVNPNPTAEIIPDYEFCDDTDDNDGNNGSITLTKADFDTLIPSILGAEFVLTALIDLNFNASESISEELAISALINKTPIIGVKLILLDIIKFFPQRARQCHKLPCSHLDR